MSKDTILFLAGLGVAVLPFLGFPNSWRTPLFVALGVLIIGVAVSLRREFMARDREAQARRSGVFVESGGNPHGGPSEH